MTAPFLLISPGRIDVEEISVYMNKDVLCSCMAY